MILEIKKIGENGSYIEWQITLSNYEFAIIKRPKNEKLSELVEKIENLKPENNRALLILNAKL